MGLVLTIIEGLGYLWGLIRANKDQQIGRQQQKLEDDQATLKGAEDAQRVNESLKGLADADLDKRVADSMRDPGTRH